MQDSVLFDVKGETGAHAEPERKGPHVMKAFAGKPERRRDQAVVAWINTPQKK